MKLIAAALLLLLAAADAATAEKRTRPANNSRSSAAKPNQKALRSLRLDPCHPPSDTVSGTCNPEFCNDGSGSCQWLKEHPEYARDPVTTACIPASCLETCKGANEFEAGYGGCSSYSSHLPTEESSYPYCSVDKDSHSGLLAESACSECGKCVDPAAIDRFELVGDGNCLDRSGNNLDKVDFNGVTSVEQCATTCLGLDKHIGFHWYNGGGGWCSCAFSDGTLPSPIPSEADASEANFIGVAPVVSADGNSALVCYKIYASCGIARGQTVYPGCGHVYQSKANLDEQCGFPDNNGKAFIPAEGTAATGFGSCGIARGQLVYEGCGYVYQSKANLDEQCGFPDNSGKAFIPAE